MPEPAPIPLAVASARALFDQLTDEVRHGCAAARPVLPALVEEDLPTFPGDPVDEGWGPIDVVPARRGHARWSDTSNLAVHRADPVKVGPPWTSDRIRDGVPVRHAAPPRARRGGPGRRPGPPPPAGLPRRGRRPRGGDGRSGSPLD